MPSKKLLRVMTATFSKGGGRKVLEGASSAGLDICLGSISICVVPKNYCLGVVKLLYVISHFNIFLLEKNNKTLHNFLEDLKVSEYTSLFLG